MYPNRLYHTALIMLVLFLGMPLIAQAAPEFETREEYIEWMYHNAPIVNEIMVKFKPGIEPKPRASISKKKAKELGEFVGVKLKPGGIFLMDDWQILQTDHRMTEAQMEAICVKLRLHPDVVGADPNGSVFPMMTSTDPRFTDQWSLQTGVGATEVTKAWDITSGAAATVVAVIDSGITVHEDLAAARILPGYDFVSDPVLANDGGGAMPTLPIRATG